MLDKKIKKLILVLIAIYSPELLGAPPFITDDPYPADYKHWEIYLFSETDKNPNNLEIAMPALEVNYGIFHRVEISATMAINHNKPYEDDEPAALGPGDLELALKYAFIKENKTRPQVAINPTFFVPTGDADKGLGNGRSWWLLPLLIGKTWDKWEVYGGAGYARNTAPDERNFWFGGIAIQRDVTDKLMLGGELFAQGADAIDTRSFALVNLGGSYGFTKQVSILFSMGHSIMGEKHFFSYLALGLDI